MKAIIFILTMLFIVPNIWSQSNGQQLGEVTTYALIIGVSDYPHDSISSLQFAHKDAEIFANFLTTPNGGSGPWRVCIYAAKYHLYTLSRINAALGNKKKALDLLKEAEEKGFKEYWVMQKDPLMVNLKNTNLYIEMLERGLISSDESNKN